MSTRPSTDEWFLGIAKAVSTMADCTRSQVGAVIAMGKEIIQPGYNGAPPGMPGCLTAGACPRGRQDYNELPRTENYDTGPGTCIAVHAEANAIVRAGRDRCIGATMYVTRKPCDGCMKLILAAGIERVVWPDMPEELRTYRRG